MLQACTEKSLVLLQNRYLTQVLLHHRCQPHAWLIA